MRSKALRQTSMESARAVVTSSLCVSSKWIRLGKVDVVI